MREKINKIKDTRAEESEKKARQQQEEQMKIIEATNQQLEAEANKRNELEKILSEMEERMVIGGNVLAEKEREQMQA